MHAAGPIVDSTMTLSILSSRDADPNIMFRLSLGLSLLCFLFYPLFFLEFLNFWPDYSHEIHRLFF